MGPDSLQPMDLPKKPINLWLVAAMVFLIGLGAGVVIPAGMKYFDQEDNKVASDEKEPVTLPLPNGKLRRVDPPLSHETASKETKTAKSKAEKHRQKLAAAAFRENRNKKEESRATRAAAKVETRAESREKAPANRERSAPTRTRLAKTERAAPSSELIEEVPSALTAVQVERLMLSNSVGSANNQRAVARPVSLPPTQNLGNPGQAVTPLPILKTSPRGSSKTYPVSINNASFSKANLANCTRRCALMGMDAMGKPIKAIINGATYAAALMQHNGTINISGQPRIIKNQQVLVVENITFNLAPSQKSVAARRGRAAGVPAAEEASGYTEVSFEGDDLKPGTVIKSRKQIPIEDQQEIPAP
ncbi:hypothetical protein [Oligoflexus tunisiensis]|uniref:hypothetical protein n=1 Tax=Oligoflexus tunisiensis TaxID=708132 RepID=UPI00114CE35E|nr:hypothetical protein [Oligoflexus tunisiensis]